MTECLYIKLVGRFIIWLGKIETRAHFVPMNQPKVNTVQTRYHASRCDIIASAMENVARRVFWLLLDTISILCAHEYQMFGLVPLLLLLLLACFHYVHKFVYVV